ncbi:MAG: hypothetical protein AAF717_14030 [Bacteroidota bacterium]
MKKYLLLLVLVILTDLIEAQDLIVTTSNDSIKCKITKVKKDYLYFMFKMDDSFQSTVIEKSKVLNYILDYYPEYHIPKDSLPGYEKYPRHSLSIKGGLSYDPRRRNPAFLSGFDDYLRDLRSGYNIGGDYSYFFNRNWGIGITANYFNTNANLEDVSGTDNTGNTVISTLSNEITVFYVGPSISLRFMNKTQRNAFIWNTSIGYIDYQDTYFYVEETITRGSGLGTVSTFGYYFGVNDSLSLGLELGLVASYFRTIQIESINGSTEIELSRDERPLGSARLDFSIGIRYQL